VYQSLARTLTCASGHCSRVSTVLLVVASTSCAAQVGEVRKLNIPSDEGYGAEGFAEWGIPANAGLIFEIEVLTIAGKPYTGSVADNSAHSGSGGRGGGGGDSVELESVGD
jgi:hypothetical protein